MTNYVPTPEDEYNEKLRMEMIARRNSQAAADIRRIQSIQQQARIDNAIAKFFNQQKGS